MIARSLPRARALSLCLCACWLLSSIHLLWFWPGMLMCLQAEMIDQFPKPRLGQQEGNCLHHWASLALFKCTAPAPAGPFTAWPFPYLFCAVGLIDGHFFLSTNSAQGYWHFENARDILGLRPRSMEAVSHPLQLPKLQSQPCFVPRAH